MLGARVAADALARSKRDFVSFASFHLICSRQDQPGDAVLKDRLVKVDVWSQESSVAQVRASYIARKSIRSIPTPSAEDLSEHSRADSEFPSLSYLRFLLFNPWSHGSDFTLRCFSQSDTSRMDEHQLPRKGYFKIPRSHCREDPLGNEIFKK